jgi:3-hydroxyisobutyrate dehydrogenase
MVNLQPITASPVGFVGLGAMGLPMASRVARLGRPVVAYDVALSARARQSPGLVLANSPHDVATRASTIVLSLPHAQASEVVINELCNAPSCCKLVIDTCTQDPAQAQVLAARLERVGTAYCDAPVFGTPDDAAAGTLTVAYSGREEIRGAVEPVLTAFSRRQLHVGPVGTASVFKVVQNSLGLVQLVAIAEAFAVVEALGADPVKFYEVVNGSGGMADGPFFAKTGRDFADKQARFGACLRVAMKDVELGRTVAMRVGAEADLIAAAAVVFKRAENVGLGDADLTSIGQVLGRKANA